MKKILITLCFTITTLHCSELNLAEQIQQKSEYSCNALSVTQDAQAQHVFARQFRDQLANTTQKQQFYILQRLLLLWYILYLILDPVNGYWDVNNNTILRINEICSNNAYEGSLFEWEPIPHFFLIPTYYTTDSIILKTKKPKDFCDKNEQKLFDCINLDSFLLKNCKILEKISKTVNYFEKTRICLEALFTSNDYRSSLITYKKTCHNETEKTGKLTKYNDICYENYSTKNSEINKWYCYAQDDADKRLNAVNTVRDVCMKQYLYARHYFDCFMQFPVKYIKPKPEVCVNDMAYNYFVSNNAADAAVIKLANILSLTTAAIIAVLASMNF